MRAPKRCLDPERKGAAAARPSSGRRAFAGGTLALAAAWALPGCATIEPELSRSPPPRAPDDLTRLRDGGPDPVVAGETLRGDLLRRFYAQRGFEPVWTTRPAQAAALADVVLAAGDHGLDPELFQAGLLQRRATLAPLQRDMLLSHAVLTYAEALALGAVPAARRRDGEALAPDPVDVARVLDAALDRRDPAAAIEALAPATPTYEALRRALVQLRDGAAASDGLVADALARSARGIAVNLERQRWLPRRIPPDRVWVNVADQQVTFYRDDQAVFTSRVVVGDVIERKQSPEFRTVIESSLLNPPWVVPRDIVEADILPRLERDPGFLERHNITLLPNGEAEQAPGPESGLGAIMFVMPNRFDVYLHDTPDKSAFGRENRRISNGCIRVENPLQLASLLMEKPLGAIHEAIAEGGTTRKPLPRPVPVFVTYQTAFATADGTLQFRPDFYARDAGIWRQLRKNPGPEETPEPAPEAAPAVAAATRPSPGPRSTRRPQPRPAPRLVEPRRR
ncbi:L,D-transpeptidase family protein [Falsiroseomonas bella]|uniref:L,D-transpeptidase family protein n=1 Tax=Falsiroseomonas bella TaxID=2184016 RepID=UPI0013049730|nr:L,D-transpeptidase family protein [Falsiroseomonas bella]